jgi:hypothetical protein
MLITGGNPGAEIMKDREVSNAAMIDRRENPSASGAALLISFSSTFSPEQLKSVELRSCCRISDISFFSWIRARILPVCNSARMVSHISGIRIHTWASTSPVIYHLASVPCLNLLSTEPDRFARH